MIGGACVFRERTEAATWARRAPNPPWATHSWVSGTEVASGEGRPLLLVSSASCETAAIFEEEEEEEEDDDEEEDEDVAVAVAARGAVGAPVEACGGPLMAIDVNPPGPAPKPAAVVAIPAPPAATAATAAVAAGAGASGPARDGRRGTGAGIDDVATPDDDEYDVDANVDVEAGSSGPYVR